MEEYREVKLAIDDLLKINSVVRRKKKQEADKKRELFCGIINGIEQLNLRGTLALADLSLDMGSYDEKFFEIIDALIYINFGKECTELISFYLWNRINADGTINPILDDQGSEIFLTTPYELYDLLLRINPKI